MKPVDMPVAINSARQRFLLASVAISVIVGSAVPTEAAYRRAASSEPSAAKDFGELPKGPLQLVVSHSSQRITLYAGGTPVTQAPIATGIAAKPTPMGIFSIIEKDRYHHSNIYSGAPMPFMQRITWTGVALHEGVVPGHPASHGCIRMVHDFAAKLWPTTDLGVRVVVSPTDVTPQPFSHPKLFSPKSAPGIPVGGGDTDHRASLPVQVAEAAGKVQSDAATDTAVSATAATDNLDPAVLAALAHPFGGPNISTPASRKLRPTKSQVSQNANLAVFVSRKEGKLFVRQGFVPLFEAPVTIERPDDPLGTHLYTALDVSDSAVRWNAISVSYPQRSAAAPVIYVRGRREAQAPPAPVSLAKPSTASEALDRITIAPDVMERIGSLLTSGSSLVISDEGLGRETSHGTDFVVVLK
jgi:L,D-transpeptidase catalytic domain